MVKPALSRRSISDSGRSKVTARGTTGRIGKIAARRDVEVVAEDLAETYAILARLLERHIDASDQERQGLAKMVENVFQLGYLSKTPDSTMRMPSIAVVTV